MLTIYILLFAMHIISGANSFLYKNYEGAHCLVGQSVGTFQTETVLRCGFRCEETPMCTSFTYFKPNFTCDLKRPVSKQTLISSPTNVPGCLFFYKVLAI